MHVDEERRWRSLALEHRKRPVSGWQPEISRACIACMRHSSVDSIRNVPHKLQSFFNLGTLDSILVGWYLIHRRRSSGPQLMHRMAVVRPRSARSGIGFNQVFGVYGVGMS